MKAVELYVQGVGLVGPGLPGWAAAQPQLAGLQPHQPAASVVPAPMRLPPAERRRAGTAIKIAIAVADAACSASGLDAAELATVFTSSSGDGGNCHALCEMLASGDRLVSPTRFTNSVHNAAAGYWHIAVGSRAPSTSLCAFDGSWGAGLIEAAALVAASGRPVLLVASDAPYPEPLQGARPLPDCCGVALVLTSEARPGHLAKLALTLEAPQPASGCADAGLEGLRRAIPAAQALPLLVALARGEAATLRFDARQALSLAVQVTPAAVSGTALGAGA
ncbi:MAG TPA: beta-ketoacyl synthase chain length factor [Burkholderiaceae bacterium]|nr:beta-ketoacyl synthase chain length factor [Burkholderiaceae bacterium]